jgi:TPR repeat protein
MENGMAWEASWQTGSAEKEGDRDVPPSGSQMDPRTVESLLRMLLERVADSDRRHGEAVDELHARLDQLSPQTTDAARATGSLEEAEMLDRLEHSIDTEVPTAATEALSARMDEIAARLDQALDQILKIENMQQVERQLSAMEQQLVRAELQARIGSIEGQLMRLIERFDDTPQRMEQVASKAANEAARLVSDNGKPSAADRLDAIHRDLVAMNERSRSTDDRLADTMAAVHQSLKQLVQQVERGTQVPQAPLAPPRAPFSERPSGVSERAGPSQPQQPHAAAPSLAEVTKTSRGSRGPDASEATPKPQLASLKTDGEVAIPPGVSLTIEEPAASTHAPAPAASTAPTVVPSNLPLPPAELDPRPLRQAVVNGDPKAQYAIGLRYAQGQGVAQNWTEAARWFDLAASAGLAPAQFCLAVMYERGQGVAKDLSRARAWYARAAEQANVKAMHNLAVFESGREGGTPDYVAASKWYVQAATRGLVNSQFNLGILAEHGLGIRKNLPDAYKWFALAALKGDAEAAKRRDLVKLQLPAATLAEAEQAVKSWKPEPVKAEANEVPEQASWQAEAPKPNKALVTRAQTLLNKFGYDVGPPDGEVGVRTRDAIKFFECVNGLEETGEVTVPLVTKLQRLSSFSGFT